MVISSTNLRTFRRRAIGYSRYIVRLKPAISRLAVPYHLASIRLHWELIQRNALHFYRTLHIIRTQVIGKCWCEIASSCYCVENWSDIMICESHSMNSVRSWYSIYVTRHTCKLYVTICLWFAPTLRQCLEDKRSLDRRLCKSIWDHISNAFGWHGRGRLVEVEHVFDAQGGLHIVELLLLLLLLGGRKITSAGHADGESM